MRREEIERQISSHESSIKELNRQLEIELKPCKLCGNEPVLHVTCGGESTGGENVIVYCQCGNKVEVAPLNIGIGGRVGESGWEHIGRQMVGAEASAVKRWNILNG